ncbi:IS5 family transposase [Herpetosiphon llansteffanensis]
MTNGVAIAPFLPSLPRRADGRRRPWTDLRAVLNGSLWLLQMGARWKDLPDGYPPYQTCHRRFQRWVAEGTFQPIVTQLALLVCDNHGIDQTEAFIDGTLVPAKKGTLAFGLTKRGKGTKVMAIADAHGLPIALHTTTAQTHEVRHGTATLDAGFLDCTPERVIGDKAYDRDPLDLALAEQGITMIAPHRRNRTAPATQDGRALCRSARRWKLERLFAWLQNFRRLVVRYEFYLGNFHGCMLLGWMRILLRYL